MVIHNVEANPLPRPYNTLHVPALPASVQASVLYVSVNHEFLAP